MKSNYSCNQIGINGVNLERLALAESSKGDFADPNQVCPIISGDFVREVVREYGKRFGQNYVQIAGTLLTHIEGHRECQDIYEGIVKAQKKLEEELMQEFRGMLRSNQEGSKKLGYMKDDFLKAMREKRSGMKKVQITLPNLGCEYAGYDYDKENDVYVVKIRQKPGCHGQAIRTVEVELPTDDPKKIVKRRI